MSAQWLLGAVQPVTSAKSCIIKHHYRGRPGVVLEYVEVLCVMSRLLEVSFSALFTKKQLQETVAQHHESGTECSQRRFPRHIDTRSTRDEANLECDVIFPGAKVYNS